MYNPNASYWLLFAPKICIVSYWKLFTNQSVKTYRNEVVVIAMHEVIAVVRSRCSRCPRLRIEREEVILLSKRNLGFKF